MVAISCDFKTTEMVLEFLTSLLFSLLVSNLLASGGNLYAILPLDLNFKKVKQKEPFMPKSPKLLELSVRNSRGYRDALHVKRHHSRPFHPRPPAIPICDYYSLFRLMAVSAT